MINHVRTLLRNSAERGGAYLGDQYVPTDAVNKQLPTWLASVWRVLFGASPDAVMLNWRLQQYLTFIHATELHGYAIRSDGRLTYWPFNTDILDRLLLGRTVNEGTGSGKKLWVIGNQFPETQDSRLLRQWDVTVVDSDTVSINHSDNNGTLQTTTAEYTTTDGASSLISLPDSSLKIRFQTGGSPRWQIEEVGLPALDLPDIVSQLEQIVTGETKTKLFTNEQDLKDVWDKSVILPYRIGSVALATAYKIEEQS